MSPRVPPATETKATRTRRRILAAAAHEFAEHGYAGTSLRQVAAGAGLRLGSLYFHFESKDELIAEVLRDGIDYALARVQAAIDALGPAATASDRLRAAIDAHLQALHETGDRAAAVVRTVDAFPQPLQRRHANHMRRYARYWATLLTDAQRAGAIDPDLDARILRDLLFAAMNSTLRPPQRRPHNIGQVAQTLATLLLREPDSRNDLTANGPAQKLSG